MIKPINLHDLHLLLRGCITFSNNRKRKNMRVSYGSKVMVEYEEQQQEYYAVTLSEQGVYLRTQNPLPVGTETPVGGQKFSFTKL